MANPQVQEPLNTSGNTYVPQYTNFMIEGDDFKTLLTRRDTQMSIAVNYKTNGIFETTETQNGEQWFGNAGNQQNKRFAFRQVYSIDPSNLTFAHNITGVTLFTRIYGAYATATPIYRPLPYVSATDVTKQIQLDVTATQIIITPGGNADAIVSGVVVLEYLKQ